MTVRAFRSLGHRLVIIGDGVHRKYLESIAGPNVEFLGYRRGEESAEVYA